MRLHHNADLTSAVLWNPDTKSAYFSKLKQLLERYNNNTQSWLIDEAWAIKALIADDARADAQIWHTTNDFDANVQMLVDQVCCLPCDRHPRVAFLATGTDFLATGTRALTHAIHLWRTQISQRRTQLYQQVYPQPPK